MVKMDKYIRHIALLVFGFQLIQGRNLPSASDREDGESCGFILCESPDYCDRVSLACRPCRLTCDTPESKQPQECQTLCHNIKDSVSIQCGFIQCSSPGEYCDHVTLACMSCATECESNNVYRKQTCEAMCKPYLDAMTQRVTTPTTEIMITTSQFQNSTNANQTGAKGTPLESSHRLLHITLQVLGTLVVLVVAVAVACICKFRSRDINLDRKPVQESSSSSTSLDSEESLL